MLRVLQKSNYSCLSRWVTVSFYSTKGIKDSPHLINPILDFEQRLSNTKDIEDCIKRRGLQFNIADFLAQWEIYKSIQSKKQQTHRQQIEVQRDLKESSKVSWAVRTTKEHKDLQRKHTLHLEAVKEDSFRLNDNVDDFEKKFAKLFLSLPNDLVDLTLQDDKYISSFGDIDAEEKAHHLVYADSIDYCDQLTYYLKGSAARFDQALPFFCLQHFRVHHFVHFSNPDFVKNCLIEATGNTLDDLYEVTHAMDVPAENSMHLVGQSSMLGFLGFLVKLRVYNTLLPLQWISSGNTYRPIVPNDNGLFNTSQSNVVQTFQAGTKEQMVQGFESTLELIHRFYRELDIHFRICRVPENQLHTSESSAVTIEMFSPHLQQYIEVGHLSYYTDYISKRLLFHYVKDKKNNVTDFPHLVSGTVCNVTRLIAIALETHNGVIPNALFEKITKNHLK